MTKEEITEIVIETINQTLAADEDPAIANTDAIDEKQEIIEYQEKQISRLSNMVSILREQIKDYEKDIALLREWNENQARTIAKYQNKFDYLHCEKTIKDEKDEIAKVMKQFDNMVFSIKSSWTSPPQSPHPIGGGGILFIHKLALAHIS